MKRADVSIKPKFGLSLRKASCVALLAFATAASSTILSGCASAPTLPEIRESYKKRLKDLDDWFFNQLVACRSDSNPQLCTQQIRESYLRSRELLIKAEDAATNNRWQVELDALKALRERLLGLLPQFPDLKEVIELLERLIREQEEKGKLDLRLLKPDEMPITTPPNPAIQPGGGTTGNNTALTLPPTPCVSDEILIRGTASVERDFVQYDADVDIELQLSSCNDEGINKITPVKGGSVKFVTPLGKIFGVIDGSQDSKIVMGPGGTGTIELWITFQPDADPWLNQIHGTNYVKLPIKANAARELVIDIDWSYLRQAFPRPYSKLADFNLDGALTTADYAAFLADYNIQGVRADATVDGVWNQSDIDKFWEDFNYEQSVPR